jgi:EmrB/QacA subfamily drug resistance transporter
VGSGHRLLAEPPPLQALRSLATYRWLVVGTVCIGAFLGQLDASIAGLVLPTLEDAFQAPVATIEWVAIAYLLTLAALVVPLGRLADLAGRKALYILGFGVFVIGSALCGLAPGLGWLIGFRVLQAAGAAMLQANSVAIIASAVPRAKLGTAIGVQGAAQAVGLAVGPSVGGFLITAFDWRAVFFIAVPFGLFGAILGWLVLPLTSRPAEAAGTPVAERFDWPGALLLGPTVALVLFALTNGNSWGWTSPQIVLLSLATIVSLGAFIRAERRAPSPLVDFALFRDRSFTLGIAAGLLSYAVLFGCLFLVPFYLERVIGRSAQETGLLLAPVPIGIGLLAPFAGRLTDRIGTRLPTVAGMLICTAALATLAAISVRQLPVTVALLALLGVGLGLFTPGNNSGVMGSAPANRLGVASGVLNMTRSVGTSLGVAATGAVLTALLSIELGQVVTSTQNLPVGALQAPFHETLLFLAGLALVAAGLSATRSSVPQTAASPAQQTALGEATGV